MQISGDKVAVCPPYCIAILYWRWSFEPLVLPMLNLFFSTLRNGLQPPNCTMGHKSHDPCFHKKCGGVMTFVAYCTTQSGKVDLLKLRYMPCSLLRYR